MAYNAAMATTIEEPAVIMADEVVTSMETVSMVVVGANTAGGGIINLTHDLIDPISNLIAQYLYWAISHLLHRLLLQGAL